MVKSRHAIFNAVKVIASSVALTFKSEFEYKLILIFTLDATKTVQFHKELAEFLPHLVIAMDQHRIIFYRY